MFGKRILLFLALVLFMAALAVAPAGEAKAQGGSCTGSNCITVGLSDDCLNTSSPPPVQNVSLTIIRQSNGFNYVFPMPTTGTSGGLRYYSKTTGGWPNGQYQAWINTQTNGTSPTLFITINNNSWIGGYGIAHNC